MLPALTPMNNMFHYHYQPSSFQQWLAGMLMMYAVVTYRLGHYLSFMRRAMAHGLTLLLFLASGFGIYQLAQIYASQQYKPSVVQPAVTKAQAATPASAPESQALARSTPLSLDIPSLNLSTDLAPVGQNADGSMEVPEHDIAGWYTLAPSPGEIGPAIIVGHVDSPTGPAVFWNLRNLEPGNLVMVTREDGKKVSFSVEKVESYDQNNFPSDKVYGNLDYPGLRLITCDGKFDPLTRHYSHNLVVYARATPL